MPERTLAMERDRHEAEGAEGLLRRLISLWPGSGGDDPPCRVWTVGGRFGTMCKPNPFPSIHARSPSITIFEDRKTAAEAKFKNDQEFQF